MLKFVGFDESQLIDEICLYFPDVRTLPSATTDPHHLLQCLQLCRTQATTKEIELNLGGTKETFITNRSYCAGVKVCGGDNCKYTVTNKQNKSMYRAPKNGTATDRALSLSFCICIS